MAVDTSSSHGVQTRGAESHVRVVAPGHVACLQSITAALGDATTQVEVARIVADRMAPRMDGQITVVVRDESAGDLRVLARTGGAPAPIAQPALVLACCSGRAVWQCDAALPGDAAASDRVHVSRAAIPTLLGDRTLGGIGIEFAVPKPVSSADRALLEDLASHVAVALSRARAYDEAQRARDRLQLLLRASRRVAEAKLDLAAVLDAITESVMSSEFAHCCIINLRQEDGDELPLAALRHADPDRGAAAKADLQASPPTHGRGLIGEVARSGRSVRVCGAEEIERAADPRYRERLRLHPDGSVVVVPLRVSGEVIGTLGASRERSAAIFSRDDELLLQDLADRAALSIENARLYERARKERRRAEKERQRAETANRAKDDFLAMLGHELRNPLAPLLSGLQVIRMRVGDSVSIECDVVERQIARLVRLVDDLLDVSRIAQGKMDVRMAPVELAGLVSEAVDHATPLLLEREHVIVTSISPHGLVVDGDEGRLAQVLANLLANAARYTPRGGNIEVTARRRDGKVAIEVRDDGLGIEPELLPRIFDPFVQGRHARDPGAEGLGLGLAISRRIVQMHGGTLRASSAGHGLGSTFTIELTPRSDPPFPSPPRRATLAAMGAARRILVVDDNCDAAILLADGLRAIGHEVVVAHDGSSALELAERFRPEVALLDIGLPGMDGHELGRRLVALLGADAPVLVALTGYGQPSDREFSRRAGFTEHLVKPVGLARLDELIANLPPKRAGS